MKKNELLATVKESFLDAELTTNDLLEISEFCKNLAFGYDPQNNNFEKIYHGIPIPEGERRIGIFNSYFKNYSSKFIIFPQMIEFMVKQNQPANIYIIQRNRKTDIVYIIKKDGVEEVYHLDCVRKDIPVKDYYQRKADFEDKITGIKDILNTNNNPNNYGCPTKVEIPLADLQDFETSKHAFAEIFMSINDTGTDNEKNRVGLVMKYYDVTGKVIKECYDTFDPCPPGAC